MEYYHLLLQKSSVQPAVVQVFAGLVLELVAAMVRLELVVLAAAQESVVAVVLVLVAAAPAVVVSCAFFMLLPPFAIVPQLLLVYCFLPERRSK